MKIFNINEKNVLKRKNGIPFRSDKKSIKNDGQTENSGEKKLQKLIFDKPELFPVWDCTETVQSKWIPLAEEITLRQPGMGRLDILATDDEGNIFIVECKLEDNPDMKTIRSQIQNYAAGFFKDCKTNGIDSFWEWLIQNIKNQNEEIKKIFEKNGIEDDEHIEEILKNMKRNFEENNIILIFAVDRITENLRTDLDWWNTALNKKDQNYPSYAFEITQYSDSEKNKTPSTIVTQLYPINHEQIISNKRKNNSKRPIRTYKKWIELVENDKKLNKQQKIQILKFKDDLEELIKKDGGQLEPTNAEKSRLLPKFSNYEKRSPIGITNTGELYFQFGLIRNTDSNNPKFRIAEEKFRNRILQIGSFKHVSRIKNPKRHNLPQEHAVEADTWLKHKKELLDILKDVFTTL